ncbi:hypothetical protein [Streptomyces sp. cmx-10-25]|uniref:hypothetical protein n=1 Tax=Streptomyces sp. cmx-10-25 TaxID=2790919 RepID=UPI0039808847
MDRTQHLSYATEAIISADKLAIAAERAARSESHKTAPLAAAGALWADIARAHAAIATALADDTTTED